MKTKDSEANDEPNNIVADLVRQCFSAYVSKDRQALEQLLSDDFRFHSPHDPDIDKKTYFEKCWPFSEREFKLFTLRSSSHKVTKPLSATNVSQRMATNFATPNSSGSREIRSKKLRSTMGLFLKAFRRNRVRHSICEASSLRNA
jgi:hypothetical protein